MPATAMSSAGRGRAVETPGTRRALRLAARQMTETRRRLGSELRTLREDAGLSLRSVARASGIGHAHLLRIERATVEAAPETLAAVAAVLGTDLSLRLYPQTGPILRDHIQSAIVDALLRLIHPRWRPHLEVPVSRPARGVVDLVLTDVSAGMLVAIEAQSDLRRLEQQIRWFGEKAAGLLGTDLYLSLGPGAQPVARVLVLRSSRSTRTAAMTYDALLRNAYPARAAAIHSSLTEAAPWPGDGILWASRDGTTTKILPSPPPRVALGR